jgi:hypothetical protein
MHVVGAVLFGDGDGMIGDGDGMIGDGDGMIGDGDGMIGDGRLQRLPAPGAGLCIELPNRGNGFRILGEGQRGDGVASFRGVAAFGVG